MPSSEDRFTDSWLRGGSWPGELSCATSLVGESQEEHLRNFLLRKSDADCDGAKVIQLQQDLFNLRAQVASQVQIADAVRAINNLATAQARKDAPSLIKTSDIGRPKKFSGKEEDLQQWSKKTAAFFAGVVKESEMMLEWAVEQTTEITTELINREFLLTATNQGRGVQNLEFILQQMHTMPTDFTSDDANDIAANSRKNPLEAWRRLQKRNFLRIVVSPERCSLLALQAGIKRWESVVSQYEKMSEK